MYFYPGYQGRKMVGYIGLDAGGQKQQTERITKIGRKDLLHALVTSANLAIQHHPFKKKEFERLQLG